MGLKDNSYFNIKNGDRITLRNGDVLIYDEYYDKIVNSEDSRLNYKENLKHKCNRALDIIEVKRPIEYTTIFTEDDIDEEDDDEITIDEVFNKIKNIFENSEKTLKRGDILTINL